MNDTQWTEDQLYDVLYAFTHNDPDGNGENDTYGLQLNADDLFCWNPLYTMFSIDAGTDSFGAKDTI